MENPDKLTDRELDHILAQWPEPPVPEAMRSALGIGAPKPWFARMWTASIRIPVPAALALSLALAIIGVKTWRAERPAIQPAALGFRDLRPVAELKPRIIRGEHADH